MTTTPPTGPAWSVRAEYASIASPLCPVIVTVSASIASYIRCPPSRRLQPAPCFHGAASAVPAGRSGILLPETVLAVHSLDRLTRRIDDFDVLWTLLETERKILVSITEDIDFSTPGGLLEARRRVRLAQAELELIRRRAKAAYDAIVAAFRLPEGREHVAADVSFIAEPVARAGREEHSGFAEAMVIMAASGDRVGDPCRASGNGAGDLYVHSGRLTLPGVQFRVRPPRPAREQCAVHDVACSDVEFIGRGDVVEKRLYQQRGDCRDSAADRGLRDAVVLSDFRLDPVPAQIGQGYGERIAQPGYRRPSAHPWRKLAGFNSCAQLGDLGFGESGGMIHARPVSSGLSVVTQSFREAGRLSRRRAAIQRIAGRGLRDD